MLGAMGMKSDRKMKIVCEPEKSSVITKSQPVVEPKPKIETPVPAPTPAPVVAPATPKPVPKVVKSDISLTLNQDIVGDGAERVYYQAGDITVEKLDYDKPLCAVSSDKGIIPKGELSVTTFSASYNRIRVLGKVNDQNVRIYCMRVPADQESVEGLISIMGKKNITITEINSDGLQVNDSSRDSIKDTDSKENLPLPSSSTIQQ